MKRIIFFYEHVNRELDSIRRIGEKLEKSKKFNVCIFSIVFEWCDAIRHARINGIDAVVFPWIYSDRDFALAKPFLDVNPKVAIINLHQEQTGSPFTDPLLLPHGDCAKNACHHFVWGDHFAGMLYDAGVQPGLVHITGSVRMDIGLERTLYETKKHLSEQFSLDPNKHWILYAEDRGWLYQFDKRKLSSLVKRGASESMLAEREKIFRRSLEETVRQINGLQKEFFDSFEFIYRPHPGTHAEGIENPYIRIISDHPISVWLRNIDLLLVWGSTTAFEGEIAGVPVLRHEGFENSVTYRAHGLDKFPVINNLNEITRGLIEEVALNERDTDIYKNFYGPCDGASVDRTEKAVKDAILYSCQMDKPIFCGSFRYRICRKRVFEIVSRIAVRLNLVQCLKRPRITYNLYDDLPYV